MLASTIKDQDRSAPLETIAGTPPDLRALPDGCTLRARAANTPAPSASPPCPPEVTDGRNHMARCVRVSAVRGLLAFEPGLAAANVPA